MILTLNYGYAIGIVDLEGIEQFLGYIQDIFPTLELFKISTDWMEDSRFICKVKGTKGDVIIEWE